MIISITPQTFRRHRRQRVPRKLRGCGHSMWARSTSSFDRRRLNWGGTAGHAAPGKKQGGNFGAASSSLKGALLWVKKGALLWVRGSQCNMGGRADGFPARIRIGYRADRANAKRREVKGEEVANSRNRRGDNSARCGTHQRPQLSRNAVNRPDASDKRRWFVSRSLAGGPHSSADRLPRS